VLEKSNVVIKDNGRKLDKLINIINKGVNYKGSRDKVLG
jgi:hypothetical protein